MKQNEKNSQKAQELKKEELENVNGGVGCDMKLGIRRNDIQELRLK
jgi:hypothetical protein